MAQNSAPLIDPFDTPAAPQTQAPLAPQAASVAAGGLVDPFDTAQPPQPATMPPPMPAQRPPLLVNSIPGRLQSGVDAAQQIGRGAMGWATGADRREFDLPEIGAFNGAAGMTSPPTNDAGYARMPKGLGMLALGRDDKQKAGIWSQNNPDSPVKYDKFGNAIATWGGQDFYLNRPGPTGQDFDDITVMSAALPLASALSKLWAGALGFPGRIGGAGMGFAAGGAIQDEAALAAGAPQGATLERAGVDAVVGGAAEGVAPLVGRMLSPALERPATAFMDASGVPTPETIRVFLQAGIDPRRVTQEMVAAFAQDARSATDPLAAARFAASRSLPVPVPMTRGQISGLPSDQMTEDMMQKGALGRGAEITMQGQRAAEQDALRGNVGAIQGQVANGAPNVPVQGQGGAMAQQRLAMMERAQKRSASAAYDAAKTADPAWVPAAETQRMGADMTNAVVSDHAIATLPKASALLENFAKLGADGNPNTVIDHMFTWRKQATNAATAGGEEAVAIGKMIKALDRNMDGLLTSDLLKGNPESITLWREAIGKWREFRETWSNPDLVGKLVSRERVAGESQLKVAPEAAANLIFGTSNLGFASRPELARQMIRMRDLLGVNSPEWAALKEEAWLRFARQGEGPMEGGRQVFSGAKFKTAWDDAQGRNAPLMGVLFGTEERRLISQFADVAAQVTNPVRGGQNFSNTTPAAVNIIGKVMDKLVASDGGKSYLSLILPSGLLSRVNNIRAYGAVGATPAQVRPGPGTIGPPVAGIGEQTFGQQ